MKKSYISPVIENDQLDLCGTLMGPGPKGSPIEPTIGAPKHSFNYLPD